MILTLQVLQELFLLLQPFFCEDVFKVQLFIIKMFRSGHFLHLDSTHKFNMPADSVAIVPP